MLFCFFLLYWNSLLSIGMFDSSGMFEVVLVFFLEV